ncbi:MAG: PLP-dependent transferase [Xanthomonadales bacterium]|nr:PLP-dependent transferase [Xanthomonadales bacterium]
MQKLSAESWLVSAGRPEEPGEPLNTPLVPASNFIGPGAPGYSRDGGTPTWDALEALLGGLEDGHALAFSSGMAAAAAVFEQLRTGSRVALPTDCYQGVTALAAAGETRGRWRVSTIDVLDTDRWVATAQTHDLLWLESPSNPLLAIADLAAICAAPRQPDALLVVDNTFATPLNQQPLVLGADISMQSATKFIGGHSDLLAGVLTVRDTALLERLRQVRTLNGATPGVLEAWLAVRGVRTLALRLQRAQETAGRLARFLEAHESVETTRYPGLESHPGHALAKRQLRGFGTMISFDLRGGAAAADAVCAAIRLIRHATSLGSVESTMERRAAVAGQEHLPASLLRLSVGIESGDDLCADLEQALAASSR